MPNPDPTTTTSEASAPPPATDSRPPERVVVWPPDDAFQRAEQIKRDHGYYEAESPGYGRLNAPMVTQLTRLAQTIATPEALITTEPPKEGKPYTSTGLSSLQPQIDVMHAIFGPPHWRLREREIEQGVLDLELVIGNDLDAPPRIEPDAGETHAAPAEVLLRHRMRGSHTRGRSHGDRYKGALTNGAKRLLAMSGACADVWRFGADPDETHNTTDGGGERDARKPSDKQVNFLARLVRENAGLNIHRWITRIHEMVGVDEQPPEAITDTYIRDLIGKLDRGQARTMIDALLAVRDAQPQSPATSAPRDTSAGGSEADGTASAAPGPPAGELVPVDFAHMGPNGADGDDAA